MEIFSLLSRPSRGTLLEMAGCVLESRSGTAQTFDLATMLVAFAQDMGLSAEQVKKFREDTDKRSLLQKQG
jgi:hypothetical protein